MSKSVIGIAVIALACLLAGAALAKGGGHGAVMVMAMAAVTEEVTAVDTMVAGTSAVMV
jgi:hypothetical protein